MTIARKFSLGFLIAALLPLVIMGLVGMAIFHDFHERLSQNRNQAIQEARQRMIQTVRDKGLLVARFLRGYFQDVETLRKLQENCFRSSPAENTVFSDLYPDKPASGFGPCGYIHPEYGGFGNWDRRRYHGSIWITRPMVERSRKDPTFQKRLSQYVKSALPMAPLLQAFHEKNQETCDLAWTFFTDGVAHNYPENLEEKLKVNPDANELDESQEDYVRLFNPENNPQRKTGWLPAYLDASKRVWMASCIAPLYDQDTFVGTIGMDIVISRWLEWLMQLKTGDDGYLFLLSDSGFPLAFPELGIADLVVDDLQKAALRENLKPAAAQQWTPALIQALQKPLSGNLNPDSLRTASASISTSGSLAHRKYVTSLFDRMKRQETGVSSFCSNEEKLVAFAPIGEAGWSIGIVVSQKVILGISETARTRIDLAMEKYVFMLGGGILLTALLMGFLGGWSGRIFTRPIKDMIDSIQGVSQGRDWKPLVARTEDELRVLAESANTMVQKLHDNEQLLSDIFNGVSDAIVLQDAETGRIMRVNQKMCLMFKCTPEQAGQARMADLSSGISPYTEESALEKIHQAMSGTISPFQWQSKDLQGNLFWTEVSLSRAQIGLTTAILAVVRDISERVTAEMERLKLAHNLLQTQKLESLGVLAGGIAHDFNNLLMAILGHADLAQRELPPDSTAHPHLREINQASRRAADLCRQMLAYSGRGKFVIEPIDLSGMVQEMLHLLKTGISKKADLSLQLAPQLPHFPGDATQIRQVIMNLVINASDSLGENNGRISISTSVKNLSQEDLQSNVTRDILDPGKYLCLEVSDDGCGMDQQTRERIFEPFFTTKVTGRGLGLSAVLGIVKSHRGMLALFSQPGTGTRFTVAFPVQTTLLTKPDVSAPRPEKKTSGTVLFVEDETLLQGLGQKMLKHLGFQAIIAGDGKEAVELYQQQQSGIDLVILDMTMPRMNGEEAFFELKGLNPQVKIILASGFTESEISDRFAGKGLAGCIQKPYDIQTLSLAIQQAL